MGLLEELIILVKETIDEVNERNRPRPTPTPAAPHTSEESDDDGAEADDEMATLRQTLARRAAQARFAETQAEAERAAEQQAQVERQRHARERELHHQKQVQAVKAATVDRQRGAVDPRRMARLVRQPQALREMIVLREILDKPLALRRR